MAAEYSRELGIKSYEGQKRLVTMGYKIGGRAGYALRRMMLSSDGKPKQILHDGEYKSLTTDRVILVPGPKKETALVREIFAMVLRGLRCSEISRNLNKRGFGAKTVECGTTKRSEQCSHTLNTLVVMFGVRPRKNCTGRQFLFRGKGG